MRRRTPSSTLFPYTTLFRSRANVHRRDSDVHLVKPRHPTSARQATQGSSQNRGSDGLRSDRPALPTALPGDTVSLRSEEHTSELQSLRHLVCRLLLEKKNTR